MTEFANEVLAVNIFPLKGAQPATLDGEYPAELLATPAGFTAGGYSDRQYFVAAETDSGLTVVTPRGWDDDDGPRVAHRDDRFLAAIAVDISGRTIQFTAPDGGGLGFAEREHDPGEAAAQMPARAKMHGSFVLGIDQGPIAAEFVSGVIGRDAKLFRVPDGAPRKLRDGSPSKAHAADGNAYLITNQPSLDELNQLEGLDIPMARYRSNVVVNLGEAFAEDTAGIVEIGDKWFRVVSACGRCIVTNLDSRGERVGGGLRVLRSRNGTKATSSFPLPSDPEGVFFGVNANLSGFLGTSQVVKVRDHATVLSRTSPHVRLNVAAQAA